jgi:hypothetical protein
MLVLLPDEAERTLFSIRLQISKVSAAAAWEDDFRPHSHPTEANDNL